MYDDYSTDRVRRHRQHIQNIHDDCDPNRCAEAECLRLAYEEKCYDKALIDEMLNQGLDPAEWWDRVWPCVPPDHTYAEAVSRLEGFDGEPDFVARSWARLNVSVIVARMPTIVIGSAGKVTNK